MLVKLRLDLILSFNLLCRFKLAQPRIKINMPEKQKTLAQTDRAQKDLRNQPQTRRAQDADKALKRNIKRRKQQQKLRTQNDNN